MVNAKRGIRRLLFAAVLCMGAGCLDLAPAGAAQSAPVHATEHMVVAAHPLAAAAGRDILRRGGSAVDAAIAVQMVLNLVEPQSSGIGGGAFLLHYDAERRRITAYDGRETAPAAADADLFRTEDGEAMPFFAAVVGGRSVGVPGLLRMLELAHAREGRLPWASLFEPAIALAENGFPVSPRLHAMIANDRYLATYPDARRYFFTGTGEPLPVGHILKNPALADTLRIVARDGADAFYEGAVARAIAFAVQSASDNPGDLTTGDLAAYEAKVREPVCRIYRRLRVCGMPPPTSGGTTVLQILGILENFALGRIEPGSVAAAHLIAEASRLAFADRNRYLADPDFVDVPVRELLRPGYLRRRSKAISMEESIGPAEPGSPRRDHGSLLRSGLTLEQPSTTHISIVDAEGDAVSMTSSIESAFGSRLMVRGFLLNNQLTDFSFLPEEDGRRVANRVAPGKRPRSSMAPTIVLNGTSRLRMVIGSPGGSRIIGYVAQTLVGVIDWKLDIQAAIDLPHVVNRNGATEIEDGTPGLEALVSGLRARGHETSVVGMTSGLHGIVVDHRGLWGGADPRREGLALGD